MSIQILSIGKAVPEQVISNHRLSTFLDTNDEWITTRTGIKSRYIATEETLVSLCEEAVMKALHQAKLASKDIDLILCSTLCG
ncbi:MAG TPA: 3-oxoacyl-ACP synthase, partial [Clostridiales bacterium]|nr:3-oxoacyl-ACP synthase [Clostridiales bacterium]